MNSNWVRRGTAALGIAALGVVGFSGGPASGQGTRDTGAAESAWWSTALPADWSQGWGSLEDWGTLPGWGGTDGSPGTGDSQGLGGMPWSGGTDTSTASDTLSESAQQAVSEITPSVVNIDTVLSYGSAQAAGTGIVLSADGLILTNHHVVEGATAVTGTVVGTGETYQATVLGYDPATDVAVIRLENASNLPVAELAGADSLDLGELVVGVGNAGGDGGEPTSREGVVTALDQTITATDAAGGDAETLHGLIGTNAAIQSGQSGGPLVDSTGAVVGVDVAASSTYSGESATNGYAIPIEDAVAVAEQIVSGTETSTIHVGATAFLGVQLASSASGDGSVGGSQDQYGYGMPGDLGQQFGFGDQGGFSGQGSDDQSAYSSGTSGLVIAGVVDGSAAEAAGLAAGDTLTAFDGTSISAAEQLTQLIGAHDVGDSVTLTWVDASGSSHQATVRLGEGPVG